MNRVEVNGIVKIFQKVYGEKFNIDQDGFNVWCECMDDLRYDVAHKAAMEYVRKSQYPPTIADIRNEYDALWSEYLAMVRHIDESFDSAAGYYPNITDEQRAKGKKLFNQYVGSKPRDQREREARNLSQRIINFVKECEAGIEEHIIQFDKCVENLIQA